MQLESFLSGLIVMAVVISVWAGIASMINSYNKNKRKQSHEIYRIKADISMLMSSKDLTFSRLYNIEKQLKELKQHGNDRCQ